MFDLGHGVKLGFVGFTNGVDAWIMFPGNLDPFEVRPVSRP